MPVRALAAILIVAAAGQTRPADTTRVLVRYSVSSEDDSTNAGRVVLQLTGSDQKEAVVWEAGCHVAASDDGSAIPSSADQSWDLRVDLTRGRDSRPAVRVRHRHFTARGTSAEETRVLAIGATDTLSLNELSAHTDCRYDRIHVTVSAESARASRPAWQD
ncbi:MAG TPA: hypothetical protein VJN96_20395 [Vicinamibacterales bacterium]|nr:hypothetical protein [Vicinamibacterales bacterium]